MLYVHSKTLDTMECSNSTVKRNQEHSVTRDSSIISKCYVCIFEGVLLKHYSVKNFIIDIRNIIPTK